jgi:cell wall-associated NlpC family hydrolase
VVSPLWWNAMLPTDPFSSTSVSGLVDPDGAEPARRSGRRRAAEPAIAPSAGLQIDSSVSPRRAARAAREAAAAAAMMEAVGSSAPVPTSPVVPSTAALPVVPSTAALPVVPTTAALPVVPAAAALPVVPATAALPVVPAAAASVPASAAPAPASPAPASAPISGSLAVGIPAPAASNGRRETFVPAVEHRAPARAARNTAARRRPAKPAASTPREPRVRSVGTILGRVAVGAVVCGILATTCILPAIGHTGASRAYASTNADGSTTVHIGNQTYDVAAGVDSQVLARDGYSATSVVDYEKQVIANRAAQTSTTYTGPTAAEYVLHPLYSHDPLDRAQVFDVALQYLGTPYVHGGADPSAFDCSGFIMFVYAQFGISLPHYVPSQDAIGTTIPQSEAVPGDLVIFNSDDHDGFYAGNGMIMDAPKPGGVITVRPIWDAPHHFVRINP